MSEQTLLTFHPRTPVARNSDPQTSHESALAITRDGTRKRQGEQLVLLVAQHPGLTYQELAALPSCPLNEHQVGRRLSELADPKNGAALLRGEPRRCRITGRRVATWLPNG